MMQAIWIGLIMLGVGAYGSHFTRKKDMWLFASLLALGVAGGVVLLAVGVAELLIRM
jgi:hypothetical protein